MSLISNIAKNTFYQILGKILAIILGLLTIGLMTRYLGQTGYGHYTTIIAFLHFFGVLIDFGLQMATTQMLSKPEVDEKKIFDNIFAWRLISSLVFLSAAVGLIWLLPYPLIIKQGASIASFSFFFISMQSILISIFQKKMEMAKVAIAEVWGRLVLLIGVWMVVSEQAGLLYIITAVVIGSLVNFIILFIGAKKYFPIHLDFDWQIWKKIWHTSWPLATTVVLTLVYFRMDTIIMSLYRPQNEVGLYGATYKVLEILIQMPYLFLGLILPLLTKFFTINKNLFNITIQKSLDFLIIIVVPMILATLVLSEKIIILVAGDEFLISGELLKILIFAVGIIFIGAIFGYAIVAAELQKKMIKFYLIDALISIPLYLIFIPIYSYWAAAYLTILTELIITIAGFYILKKHTGISLQAKITGKVLIAGLVMTGVLMIFTGQHLITLIIIGLIIYLWALYMLKGISKQTILEIINIKK